MMFAGLDSLIPLIVFVGIAIVSTLLKKKGEKEQEELPSTLPSGQREKTWEEQIRDLMSNRPPPRPPPIVREAPPIVRTPPPVPEPSMRTRLEPHFQTLHGLTESQQRYAKAIDIDQRVHQHMDQPAHHVHVVPTAHRKERSAVAASARLLLKDPGQLRAAILASTILGPPKGLQQEEVL